MTNVEMSGKLCSYFTDGEIGVQGRERHGPRSPGKLQAEVGLQARCPSCSLGTIAPYPGFCEMNSADCKAWYPGSLWTFMEGSEMWRLLSETCAS